MEFHRSATCAAINKEVSDFCSIINPILII